MTASAHIADVTQDSFETEVLARSRTVPVLVDFWAAWCGPCKMLMPLLAKLADEYGGKFFLAKVNTDTEQALASRYGIKSLPTVKLFRNGEAVDEFLGVQPEKTIRALLDRHVPRASDGLIEMARVELETGNPGKAQALLEEALSLDPGSDRVKLESARLALMLGQISDADKHLATLSIEARDSAEATALRAQMEFARIAAAARSADELRQAIAANPRDSGARYELAAKLVMQGEAAAALDTLLDIVRTDRKFNDDAARKAMISLFNLIGGNHPLVQEYRRKLSMALN
ncbi:MAG: thioredoxin [Gammaproteobacteria bacterium]|nr:thioredoxin [Gammaproteobacteria bacterium]